MLLPTIATSHLHQSIDQIIQAPQLKGAQIAIHICTPEGKTLYEKDADCLLVPASNHKVLSSLYALHVLGAEHRPQTKFWKHDGKLYIDSTGDPSLTTQQIKEIKAKLNLDRSWPVLVKQSYSLTPIPYWEVSDLNEYYAAPVMSLMLDEGMFGLYARDGKLESIDPSLRLKKVTHQENDAKTTKVIYDCLKRRLEISGELPKERTLLKNLPIKRPDKAAALLLGNRFEKTETLPNTQPDYIHHGKSIIDICAHSLKPSSNVFAENLIRMASQSDKSSDKPCGEKMKDFFVKTVGLKPSSLKCANDGAGCRHNLISPRNLTKILIWSQKQSYGSAFKTALAQPGQFGTLENRLKGCTFYGKTGHFDMCATLSGFIELPSKKQVIFSMMVNNANTSASNITSVIDQVVMACTKL